MIGKLTGIVDTVDEDGVILDVNGVGYLVGCPASTLSRLAVGAHAALMIEMKVSQDSIRLYTLSPRDLARALALGDKAMIGRAPGVGPKLALRIATELKDKAPSMMVGSDDAGVAASAAAPRGPEGDAVSALVHLGYSDARAAEAVARASQALGEGTEAGALIREALKGMAR